MPRCLGFPINNKLRLLALKTLLSAKLFEDRLIFIDSEALDYPKTALLEEIVAPYGFDKLCFLTPQSVDANFELASRNISNLKVKQPTEFNLPDLLISDYVFLTKQGLFELETLLEQREANYFRNRKVSNPEHIEAVKAKKQNRYDRDIIQPILDTPIIENEKPLQL